MIQMGMIGAAVIVPVVLLSVAVQMSWSPVSRRSLETFARRQAVTITAANGPMVMGCLAVTQSWRRFGLATGIVCGFLWAARDARITLNFTVGFLGWFVGAVVAEWRIAGLPREEGRRMASLQRRTVSSYLGLAARALVALAVLVLAVSFLAVLVMAGAAGEGVSTPALLWAAAAGAGLVLVGLTLRRVATRRQPPAAPDLIAADDALRAKAATVLAGSAIAATGLPTATMFELIGEQVDGDVGAWASVGLAVMLVEFVVGFVVATAVTPARPRSRPSDGVATAP